MTLTDFTARVRKVLDMDNISGLITANDTDAATLDAIIEGNAVPAAREIVSLAPARLLAAGARTDGVTVTLEESHGAYIATAALPETFFRLLHVRMKSWERPARIITDGDAEYALQSSPWQRLRGNPGTPVAALVKDGTEKCGYRLELYTSDSANDTLSGIGYVTLPRIKDSSLSVPGRLEDAAVYACASLTAETFGNAGLAARFMNHACRLAEITTTNTADNNGDKE